MAATAYGTFQTCTHLMSPPPLLAQWLEYVSFPLVSLSSIGLSVMPATTTPPTEFNPDSRVLCTQDPVDKPAWLSTARSNAGTHEWLCRGKLACNI